MEKNEFYSCSTDVRRIFDAVLGEMKDAEFLNAVVRKAKSRKCDVKGCRKTGSYLILVQYFPQIPNKKLQ